MRLAWGRAEKIVTVTEDQASDPVNYPLIITLDKTVIELAGDSAGVAVTYQVVDEVGNHPDERSPWSAISYILVDLGGNRLDAPLVLEADPVTHVIDLETLGDADVTVLVNTTGGHFKVNDTIVMTWIGTPAEGSPVIEGPIERPVSRVGVAVTFSIPNAKVRAIAKGRASVSYVLKSQGVTDRPSKNTSVSVEGKISPLRPPSVDEAPGAILNPDEPWATVNIPYYPGRQNSDLVTLIWEAPRPGGRPPYHEDARPAGNLPENQPIQRSVSNSVIREFNGLKVDVYYKVANDDVALRSVRESEHYLMQVGVALPQFPRPEVEEVEAGSDVLDPDKVPSTGATLVMPFLGTRDKDRVTYHWRGSAIGTSDYVDLTSQTAGKAVKFTVLKQYVTNNLDGTLSIDYLITRDGVTLGHSFKRDLWVRAQLELKPPSVKEAPGGTLNPINAKDFLTVVVPHYTGMLGSDKLSVTWAGTAGGGSHTSAPVDVGTVGSKEIPIPNSVVAFNLGKAVTVTYTVTRDGTAYPPSQPLTLTVQAIPNQDGALPTPAIEGAVGNELNIGTLIGTENLRIAAWPLQLSGQRVWLRYDGTDTAGDATEAIVWTGQAHNKTGELVTLAPHVWLKTLKDGTDLKVTFRVNFDKVSNAATAVTFPIRTYTVRELALIKPTLDSVKGSPSGEEIPDNGYSVETAVTLSGTATKGLEVEVFDGATSRGKATANATTGIWTLSVSGLSQTAHSFTAKALYGSGEESGARAINVTALITPTLVKVLDADGQEIPEAGTTTSTTLTLSGKASNGLRVEIYEGSGAGAVSHGIATANATTGDWQHPVTLAQGGRRLYAQSRYHSSTVYTNVRTLTIVPVEAPTLTSVKGSPSGEDIAEGGTTVETAVTLSGTASKGQNVEVFDGPTSKGQAMADKGTGVWSLLVSGLSVAAHSFKAKALYGTGVSSAERTFTVVNRLIIDTTQMTLSGFSVKMPWPKRGADSIGNTQTRVPTRGVPPYRYSSSKIQVATVNSSGKVTGERNGTASITVTDSAGATASYDVRTSNIWELIESPNKMSNSAAKQWVSQNGSPLITNENGPYPSIEDMNRVYNPIPFHDLKWTGVDFTPRPIEGLCVAYSLNTLTIARRAAASLDNVWCLRPLNYV
ncbi:hypothetical protein [Pseudomonas sp. 478]|uniref:hypothetical protein n=1 Tax=Pseudomonas sp. 478 TaxID=2183930 RepID=UPI0011B6FECF|nr:hypothetical protein [Pseudomonas sp. 478]